MISFSLKAEPIPADRIPRTLEEHGILTNHYAEEYISHPRFFAGFKEELTVTIASLREIGLEDGACLEELFRHIPGSRLRPCPPCTGLFLRLEWRDQPQSRNSVLSGTHSAPDQSVTVLSEIPEQSDDFPKGLYLRNVDGKLWLRGYICDAAYRFPGDALFAFEAINE